jgi:surface protein
MKLLLLLFSWATLIFQTSDPIYLDQNGVTLKATSEAIVGETYQLEDKTYLVVDNELLRSMVNDDADLTSVITSFVTDMSYLFYKRENFNTDISSWDTSAVTSMSKMFMWAESFSGDLSSWNVSKVTDFGDMFHGTRAFNSDISSWDVSSATLMNGMFHDSYFNQNINTWDVSKVTNFSGMFDDTPYFNQPLNNWDLSSAENLGGMFAEAVSFNQDISMWDTSSVIYMTNMFRNAKQFSYDLSEWDVSKVDGKPEDFDLYAHAFKQPKWEVPSRINYILGALGLLVLVILIVNRFRTKPVKTTSISIPLFEAEFKDRLESFIADKGQNYLSKDELDVLLKIDNLTFESQKTKRAQLIKRINDFYPDLILRVRNPEDKRVFIYQVSI